MNARTSTPLPDGLEVGGYRIVRTIARGGFSAVYLAHDAGGRRVALKECLPAGLAQRAPGELVPVAAAGRRVAFEDALRCFFEEARALARIDHPNVVRVLDFFRANGTVYLAMPYEGGRTLQQAIEAGGREAQGAPMPERALRALLIAVMTGLREVHARRLLHLDLKPANIWMRDDGRPVLLDFGAARRVLARAEGGAPAPMPMFTPGFAAPELAATGEAPAGPWTDLYGLGATALAAMAGAPPPPAEARAAQDALPAMLRRLEGDYGRPLLDLVHWCLRLDALERPQSVFAAQRTLLAIERAVPDGARTAAERAAILRALSRDLPAKAPSR